MRRAFDWKRSSISVLHVDAVKIGNQFSMENLAATGQLDQGCPWFSLVPEQMLSWHPNSALHCMLHVQPSQW
jgi:hypothetical protein